ncbi:hypothetical protein ONE63_005809 [Megalurothrips usitatus]|uniref:DNA polymerase eta n=1 Tax=Megalurothrips usitatus TaxID=439358 RepID=A0AAV7Y0S6_9NEOP|nr:hypothetical protein ONE63_005809 [Megalurothrips usitatus]
MVTMGDNRVIVLVDMDCFYCQVEVRLNPTHQGKPLAVVQYNQWRGGGIIAVNYEARDKGVKRGMRGDEAKKLCPGIVLCQVAEVRGKADLTKYRDAGREVVEVLQDFSTFIQVASIDESYLDLTECVEERILQISETEGGVCSEKLPSTFVIGYSDDKSNNEDQRLSGLDNWLQCLSNPSYLRLAVGAMIVEEMRAAVFARTSFRCSAGISYNKPLAKLVCAVHKPNRQTVLPPDKVGLFLSTLPVRKMRNLGGKFGKEVVERLGCETMGDLARLSLRELQRHYDEKNGLWLYNMAHGIDHEPVTVRLIPKSIGCSKNFPGRTALALQKNVDYWMLQLTTELVVRLSEDQAKNKRRAQHLTVSVSQDAEDGTLGSVTRSGPLPCYDVDRIVALALQLISKTNVAHPSTGTWDPPIKNISLSAGKFTGDCMSQKSSIQSFFKQVSKDNLQTEASSGSSETQAARQKQDVQEEGQEPSIPQKKKKRSLVNYFKQNNVSSDNDLSRDMFMDETSIGSDSDVVAAQPSARKETFIHSGKDFSFSNINASKKRKSSDKSDQARCPEILESAVGHSFFARYLLAKEKIHEAHINLEPKPSTSKSNFSSTVRELETELSDQDCENNEGNENCEKCEECGKLIALQEFPEHVDYHSALKLQKELNDQLTPPEVNAPGPSGTNKIKNQISHPPDDSSSRTTLGRDTDSNPSPPMERCSYCSKLIPLQDFPEHIDYHSALNLQRELNKPDPPSVTSNISGKNNANKKGRPSKQAPSPAKKGKYNTIASFFGPK